MKVQKPSKSLAITSKSRPAYSKNAPSDSKNEIRKRRRSKYDYVPPAEKREKKVSDPPKRVGRPSVQWVVLCECTNPIFSVKVDSIFRGSRIVAAAKYMVRTWRVPFTYELPVTPKASASHFCEIRDGIWFFRSQAGDVFRLLHRHVEGTPDADLSSFIGEKTLDNDKES